MSIGTVIKEMRAGAVEFLGEPAATVIRNWADALDAEVRRGPVAWRDVVGFEHAYEVSSMGDVRSKKTGKLLSKSLVGAGYTKVTLWANNEQTQTTAHRVVAMAFLDNPNGYKQVNHINGIKTDNRVDNLEWCSASHDHLHRYYELGHQVRAIEAVNVSTGEVIFYPSITQATRDGFDSGHIYGCLNGKIKQCNGWTFREPLAAPQPAIPDGWQLVPKEPTEAMLESGGASCGSARNGRDPLTARMTYRAMLAAAPPPPSGDAGKEGG